MNTMMMLVRREFWEHRSLWIAPLVWVSVLVLLFAWVMFVVAPGVDDVVQTKVIVEQGVAKAETMAESDKQTAYAFSYLAFGAVITGFTMIVVFFYLIDCLFTERRDRSILFWKSLPVSDTQVVLSKLATALIVVPAGVLVLSAVTQFIMYCIIWLKVHDTALSGVMPGWNFMSWMRSQAIGVGMMLGGVLWYVPIAAYLLLLSAWARRMVFLWTLLPLIAIPTLEFIFFKTRHFLDFLDYRMGGYMDQMHLDENVFHAAKRDGAGLPRVEDLYEAIEISGVFTSTDMWLGLVAAAAMVYVVIRIRRYRDES
jgi:ABC-2 type transport system permease protein